MYAIILDNKIFASCQTQNDVALYVRDFPQCVVVDAPVDFKTFEYKYINGNLIKKTDVDYAYEASLIDVLDSRRINYPPITDYLDGVVKGDQAQIQAYIDACLAVKAKYPKPSEG